MGEGLHDALPPAAPEQHALLTQLVASLRDDERIVAVWVIGSLARGSGDAHSDVDLLVAVRDEDFATLVSSWRAFLAGLAPTVFAQQLGAADKPTLTAITPDWLRFDITLASASDPRPHGYAAKLLFIRRAGRRHSRSHHRPRRCRGIACRPSPTIFSSCWACYRSRWVAANCLRG